MELLRSEGCKKYGCMLASKPTCKETRSANFFQKFGRSFPVPHFLYSSGLRSSSAETPPSPAPPPPSFSQPPPHQKNLTNASPSLSHDPRSYLPSKNWPSSHYPFQICSVYDPLPFPSLSSSATVPIQTGLTDRILLR